MFLRVCVFSIFSATCVACPLVAQTGITDGIGSLSVTEEAKETNVSRAADLLRATYISPIERRGAIPARIFKQLWGKGLDKMFGKTQESGLVQIRVFDEEGKLKDFVPSTEARDDEDFGLPETATIGRQIETGRYMGHLASNPNQNCVLDIPGPIRAEGDTVTGQFVRIGVFQMEDLRYGTRNLAHYQLVEKNASPTVNPSSSANDYSEADIQTVYAAFGKGEISFVLPGTVWRECLTCEGSGRQYDEEAIAKEAMEKFKSNYNYRTGDTAKLRPKKPYEFFYAQAKKNSFYASRFCPDCQGKKKVQVMVFIKYVK